MYRTFLLAKIHNCRLTGANLHYMGSISIDRVLLEAAGILTHEQVQVLNLSNGERLITYAIPALANSGAIELNGAAARLGMPGDRLIIMTYGQLLPEELEGHSPRVVFVNQDNQIEEIQGYNVSK
ncbi:MAG: aspartate 1-decarboxylase [Oscillatoriales cyanobacterium RM2_1_1]|nr:aspartate 1-decarboxylase [Oscillatoriales cyanobacterium SM2_3_0]NJO46443.1 aspartate 1-decarboxylase [Oscillatoriales cyanobacterium RM2_1_1]